MFSYQVKDLADKKMYSYMIFLFSIFSPGFTFLYLTDNALFHDIDIIKLIILSIIYTVPLILICLISSIYDYDENKKPNVEITVLDISIKTILSLYGFIFLHNQIEFSAIMLFYGIPVSFIFFGWIDKIKKHKKK